MLFCPICANVLVLEDMHSEYRFVCKTCPYLHPIHERVKVRENTNLQAENTDIFGDSSKQGQEKTQIDCPSCRHEEAYFTQMQTRSADEPMTVFYCCTSCSYKWSEN